jgi:hypothetical protein
VSERWGTGLVLLLAAAVLGGCGGGSPSAPVQGPDLGVPLRLADCNDWKRGDVGQRLGTIQELRDFAGGPSGSSIAPGGHGNVLEDKSAYELFQKECALFAARGFKLYKLYERAAAFTPPSGH